LHTSTASAVAVEGVAVVVLQTMVAVPTVQRMVALQTMVSVQMMAALLQTPQYHADVVVAVVAATQRWPWEEIQVVVVAVVAAAAAFLHRLPLSACSHRCH
jgi:hypothetical protein